MAAASQHHIPPQNPNTLNSSWTQIMSLKQPEQHSTFTQIFGKSQQSSFHPFHHRRSKSFSSSSSSSSSTSSEMSSLQLCTEGLGHESLDIDSVEDNLDGQDWQREEEQDYDDDNKGESMKKTANCMMMMRRTKSSVGNDYDYDYDYDHDHDHDHDRDYDFPPPPISCMGKTGKPWAGFKSYRYGGRFILKEIRAPTHEFLHASRQNGRLRLHILLPNDQPKQQPHD